MDNGPTIHRVHPNGLALELPAALSVRPATNGFLINRTADHEGRALEEVVVTRHTGASRPEGEWPRQKRIAGHTFFYRLERKEGGSGGDTHVLAAWAPYPQGYVRVEQVSQTEWPAQPNQTLAWKVMAAIGQAELREKEHVRSP